MTATGPCLRRLLTLVVGISALLGVLGVSSSPPGNAPGVATRRVFVYDAVNNASPLLSAVAPATTARPTQRARTTSLGGASSSIAVLVVAAETESELPSVIYREGTPRPGNLTPRPVDNGALSFRDTLSNPIGSAERPVLRPGEPYIGIDTSRLPPGSDVVDNVPPGHVSVTGVSVEEYLEALIERGKFPK
jgi:hypothetical protein